jgi:hypothetical protein
VDDAAAVHLELEVERPRGVEPRARREADHAFPSSSQRVSLAGFQLTPLTPSRVA